MKRHLLGALAVAAVASFAGAQQQPTTDTSMKMHGDSSAMHHSMAKSHKGTKSKRTYTSGGEIDRGGPGYSVHAVARDYVRADDSKCDDLCRREQMLDAKYGKDRERRP
ncbi:MAG: hypothetical protein JO180_08220 [Gemmatirosa sp.]|nr:hypothetical protein [Gemmatirosa sp.]